MTALVEVVERPMRLSDKPFIFSSWLRGLWSGQHGEPPNPKLMRLSLGEMRRDDFFALQHTRIERLISPANEVAVLHPVGAPDVIAGWACRDDQVLHYVHVPDEYRRQGFARRLVGSCSICTHLTLAGVSLKKALGLRYMPHLLDGAA